MSWFALQKFAAAALANLSLMHSRGTVAHAATIGDRLGAGLAGLADYEGVAEIRRIGTMTGLRRAVPTSMP